MNHQLPVNSEKGVILWAVKQAPEGVPERIGEIGDGRELVMTLDRDRVEAVADRVEIAFGDIPFDLIPRMPHLKWLQLWSAGVDILQHIPELKTLPFIMTNTSGMHGRQITEHVFGMILTWIRRLHEAYFAQKRREWLTVNPNSLATLEDKTMLILGYGAIGKTLAETARIFGMKLIGVRRHAGAGEPGITVLPITQLVEALPQVDYVVNILPLTQDTRHLFGDREFAAMKSGAVYVNVGRGATTDEAALIKALGCGRIGGALLDVMETEPLPPDSPLWNLENALLTPHYAGYHPRYQELALEIALDNLQRYVQGKPLRNLVDKAAGYGRAMFCIRMCYNEHKEHEPQGRKYRRRKQGGGSRGLAPPVRPLAPAADGVLRYPH
jgi:phosphoglycerate dehydrogenase-like enzyme